MRWMIALLFLTACAQLAVQVPAQYAVHETGANNISYVVRDGRYVACEGSINGERCTPDMLEEHGLRMEQIGRRLEGAQNISGCLVRDNERACLDELGAITAYSDGQRRWTARYVPDTG